MAIDNTRRPSDSGASGVNLGKVTLSKAAPTVSLAKKGESQGTMRVNLNWSSGAPAQPKKQGFFAKLAAAASAPSAVDLDLGCLYELADGSKGVVQALGNSFGSVQGHPFIALDGDDRSGNVAGGENMHVNLANPALFKRILIFAMIYEGAPNWAAVDGVVTLFPTSGPQVEVRLDSASNAARICAIALLQNSGQGFTVTREVKYIDGGQAELDKAYGWGMRWTAGRK
ncbi:tellurium resistance protein [Rhodococcus sp. BP-252]|uniref:TerD family protein n=1 Tax=unclassified Rhodococcus (in: high G+C Gram-positive bacteria) TaxID=192944 RepID=UPI001C9B3C41|nr:MULTISPECIES: tellurium resistance protein [unclassified Rhodococcus (in: high G+C Gram-positive bacteria)]MBY6414320.1 tellurium resistance protein [Rhodococcus sp. BP-320]MBY6419090.1 tellurium resistance protein [Rhodococcus sp. BP-321]MBY6423819.1 tellurium resistance protein [Rhodococcus sp. BP-324]MBY6429203.1 tellurium resistance protein [Rhodococcus sp. BP-323]MBY6434130.1 tellurium resistance protein [Rhodococcus sp. BP-322]